MWVEVSYLSGAALLTFYGVEVCPFLEAQSEWTLGRNLFLAFGVAYLVRQRLYRFFEAREIERLKTGQVVPPAWAYLLEMGCWSLAGGLVSLYNYWAWDFSLWLSGMKLMVGCMVLAFFAGSHGAQDRQLQNIRWLAAHPEVAPQPPGRFHSISGQFLGFFTSTLVSITAVVLLMFRKDLIVIQKAVRAGTPAPYHLIVLEVVLVNLVLLAAGFFIARRYGQNLQEMFDLELRSLEAIAAGQYDRPVPVVSNDEFARIAEGTNEMLAGLIERDRIRMAFGRYMSPAVAEAILASEEGTQLGGRLVKVVVLFTDLRNFTPLSEQLSPQELVSFLNEYFTDTVEAVHANGGVVDKFIGDAAMAVFGLDGADRPCDRAFGAALRIRRDLARLNESLAARGLPVVDNGIGIHFGEVVAGNIGSQDRLEYTVIGDAVNVAARLESATKALGVAIAVSDAVYAELDDEARGRLEDKGPVELKGKSTAVRVWGA